jgi:surfactin synthase thioesterase subunit
MICWQKYTKNRFALSCFLGNHFFVRDSNNIARIVKKITNKAEG